MKWAARRAAASASLALCCASAACYDLFHSTGDILTACEIDATAAGCTPAAGPAARFCSGSTTDARDRAAHACAWLGACEFPLGKNAFGSCELEAMLAFDCAANPNHIARGDAQATWSCLSQAQTCGDVDSCVFPAQKALCACSGDYEACALSGGKTVRTECVDGGAPPYPSAHGEPCDLWGQTCASDDGVSVCAGAAGVNCGVSGCTGSALHWCDPKTGVDVGLDCSNNGAAACGGFPVPTAAEWVACVPDGDAGTCEPDASASCLNGVAHSCPAGIPEQIDCAALLGVPEACAPGPLSPPFDWTSPCAVANPACSEDSCSGTVLTGCARGATFTVDCAQEGLGPCRMVTTDMGSATHAACAPPEP